MCVCVRVSVCACVVCGIKERDAAGALDCNPVLPHPLFCLDVRLPITTSYNPVLATPSFFCLGVRLPITQKFLRVLSGNIPPDNLSYKQRIKGVGPFSSFFILPIFETSLFGILLTILPIYKSKCVRRLFIFVSVRSGALRLHIALRRSPKFYWLWNYSPYAVPLFSNYFPILYTPDC